MTAAVMATAKKRQIAVIYIIRASTLGAKLDACSGYNGICDCTVLVCSLRFRFQRVMIAPPENQYACNDREDRQKPSQTHNPQNCGAVARGGRIVLEAVEQQVIDRTADLARGSVDQPQPDIARRV